MTLDLFDSIPGTSAAAPVAGARRDPPAGFRGSPVHAAPASDRDCVAAVSIPTNDDARRVPHVRGDDQLRGCGLGH